VQNADLQFAISNPAIMSILIQPARPDQTPIVASILTEAAQWLIDRGQPLWRLEKVTPEAISADVAAGLFYIAWRNGDAVGVMKLELEDGHFWPEMPPGEAVFLHRLAVRRAAAGGAVTPALFKYAFEHTRRLGRPFLRLDCVASRPSLRHVYERNGFVLHSEIDIKGKVSARYERSVNMVPHAGV
jgi:GNAT superfamily N-acetyltransferase